MPVHCAILSFVCLWDLALQTSCVSAAWRDASRRTLQQQVRSLQLDANRFSRKVYDVKTRQFEQLTDSQAARLKSQLLTKCLSVVPPGNLTHVILEDVQPDLVARVLANCPRLETLQLAKGCLMRFPFLVLPAAAIGASTVNPSWRAPLLRNFVLDESRTHLRRAMTDTQGARVLDSIATCSCSGWCCTPTSTGRAGNWFRDR